MAQLNITQATPTMKERLESALEFSMFQEEDALVAFFPMGSGKPVSTRAMRIALDAAPGGITANIDLDGGANKAGTGSLYDVATVSTVAFGHSRQITRRVIEACKGEEKALEDLYKKELAKMVPEFKRMLDKQLQVSTDGVLATLYSSVGSGVYNAHDSVTPSNTPFGIQLLRQNNDYDVYASNLVTLRANGPYRVIQASGLDQANRRVTVAAASAPNTPADITGYAANDVMVLQSGINANLQGLPYHLSNSASGTWQGISRANDYVQARGINAGGVALSLDHMRLAINAVIQRKGTGGGSVDKLQPYTGLPQDHAYANLIDTVMQVNKDGGYNDSADLFFKNMTAMGKTFRLNTNADPTKIQYLQKNVFGWAIMKKLGFYTDPNGNTAFPVISTTTGVPSNTMWLQVDFEGQLYCKDPTSLVYIYNLAQPTGYLP